MTGDQTRETSKSWFNWLNHIEPDDKFKKSTKKQVNKCKKLNTIEPTAIKRFN